MGDRAKTRGRCCADSAEHSVRRGALFPPAALVTTDAPFAGNVERKVSNHRARFYAADHSWIVRNLAATPDHHNVTAMQSLLRKSAIEEFGCLAAVRVLSAAVRGFELRCDTRK